MKRILFLSPNLGLSGGGSERQIVNVACGLKQKGYFVEFLCYFEGDFYENNLKDNDITVYRKLLPNYIKRLFYVRRFIRKNKYDVVISFLETPNFLNCFSAIGGKSWKVIIGERSAIDESFKAIKLKIYCSLQRFADLLVANSENAVNLRVAQFPRPTIVCNQQKREARMEGIGCCAYRNNSVLRILLRSRNSVIIDAYIGGYHAVMASVIFYAYKEVEVK